MIQFFTLMVLLISVFRMSAAVHSGTPSLFKRPGFVAPFSRGQTQSVTTVVKKESKKEKRMRKSLEKQRIRAIPLHRSEGLVAVDKPVGWTSNNILTYFRNRLESDCRKRGRKPERMKRGKYGKNSIKIGHGGTLDPLASGVLVIGVGSGTKLLQDYLKGTTKEYIAGLELGFETNTLDMEGNVTKKAPFDHVTLEKMESVLPQFIGEIQQVPPLFSALKQEGKRLYQKARKGATIEDVEIKPRPVQVYELSLENTENFPPKLDIKCSVGSGTYVRSLVRDLGYAVDSVATTVHLRRTRQGPFGIEDCVKMENLTADDIYDAIDRFNAQKQEAQVNEGAEVNGDEEVESVLPIMQSNGSVMEETHAEESDTEDTNADELPKEEISVEMKE